MWNTPRRGFVVLSIDMYGHGNSEKSAQRHLVGAGKQRQRHV